jgi:hypothetical protein
MNKKLKMNIKHIIYTRFSNVAFGFTEEELLNEVRLTEKLNIFINNTYPSMMSQTNQNFEWVIQVHDNIPKKIYDGLKLLKKITVIKNSECGNVINWSFERFVTKDTDFVVTTRLDDDDMLHLNSIDQIQNSFNQKTLLKVFGFGNGCSSYSNEFFEMSPDYNNQGFIALGLSIIYNYKIYGNIKLTVLNTGGIHVNFKNSILDNWIPIFNKINKIPVEYLESDNFWENKINPYPSYIYNRNDFSDSKRKTGDSFKPHFTNLVVDHSVITKYFNLVPSESRLD